MKRKKSNQMRLVLTCGGYGIQSRGYLADELRKLKMLLMLKKMGLAITGNVVNLCRVKCDESLYGKIKRYAENKKSIVLLSETDAGSSLPDGYRG